jgi:hypothetical protein
MHQPIESFIEADVGSERSKKLLMVVFQNGIREEEWPRSEYMSLPEN